MGLNDIRKFRIAGDVFSKNEGCLLLKTVKSWRQPHKRSWWCQRSSVFEPRCLESSKTDNNDRGVSEKGGRLERV